MLAKDEGRADLFLFQLFTVQCHLNGVGRELSISETIKMLSSVGKVRILGERENEQHRCLEALYNGKAKTQTALKEKEQEQFCDPVVAQLAGTILRQIEESDAALESYIWAAFNLMRTVLEQYLDNPLYKLGERLFENRQALAFRQCVVDGAYRQMRLANL